MRTVRIQKVFNRIIRLLGRNPKEDINDDLRDAVVDHINDRAQTIAQIWNWPEWDITEERAFRQVWNATHQYKKASDTNGQPDEVFYIPNTTYYKVNPAAITDPPVGTVPTVTAYWTQLANPIDTYVAYDQACKRSIGIVRGVFPISPLFMPNGCGCSSPLKYRPSEKGIQISHSAGPTVFILYSMPTPEYTMVPFATGRTYSRASLIFDPTVGECFQAIVDTQATPADATQWNRVPFLAIWENYVVWGAFKDCLMEYDSDMSDLQAKMVLAQNAEQTCNDEIQQQVDILAAQGQVLRWKAFPRYGLQSGSWRDSQDWSGGTVTSLTDACESDLGWIYPAQPQQVQPGIFYYSTVNSLKTTVPTLIATVPTFSMAVGTMAIISTGAHFRLDAGVANNTDPGQGQPSDYSLATNNKHWTEVI